MEKTGKFIISLDFELLWGVRDIKTPETYGKNILGVWESLPIMIELFEKYKIRGTFATVGFLFASTKDELIEYCPKIKPRYLNPNLSPYNGHLDLVKENEDLDKYHYATELISLIRKHPNQEIATHTFSHYYCLEKGQTKDDFRNDILAAKEIAKLKGIDIKSLVFPRNQFNQEYLEVLRELGITSYRGNEKAWFYNAKGEKLELFKKAFRLMDTYINISGNNCNDFLSIARNTPHDIPSSRFLRPYSSKLSKIENFRLSRITRSMTYAAINNEVYHLWWHPHNFGDNQKENMEFLAKIFKHYNFLNSKYGFESLTMSELSNLLNQQ